MVLGEIGRNFAIAEFRQLFPQHMVREILMEASR
jgi:hypothetical protein